MSNEIIKRDDNFVTILGGITNDSDQDIRMLRVDPITKRLLVQATGVSTGVTSLNGLTGAVTISAGTGISLNTVGNNIEINSTAVTAPAGSNTQVQYNDSGAFGGDAGFTYIKSTHRLTLTGGIVAGTPTSSPPIISNFYSEVAIQGTNTSGFDAVAILDLNDTAAFDDPSNAIGFGYGFFFESHNNLFTDNDHADIHFGFSDYPTFTWNELLLLPSTVANPIVLGKATRVNGALTVTGTTTLATSLTGLLKATAGVISAASAGTDYVTSVGVTSPILNTGTAANPVIWFDFSTNNIWTGTQYINLSNTAALKVGATPTFQVDTTNDQIGIGIAPGGGSLTAIITVDSTSTKRAMLLSNRAFATIVGAPTAINVVETYTFTNGLASPGALALQFTLNDNRAVSGAGSGDVLSPVYVAVNRPSSGTFTSTKATPALQMMTLALNESVSSTYTPAANATYTTTHLAAGLTQGTSVFSYAVAGTKNWTHNHKFVDANMAFAGITSTTSGTHVLQYQAFVSRGTASTVGTTYYVGFLNQMSGFDTDWSYVNETTTAHNFLGGAGVKNGMGVGAGTIALRTLVESVYFTYTSPNWDNDFQQTGATVPAGAVFNFNRQLNDVDFDVYGDTDRMFHLDAGGGTSYFENQVADTSGFFEFRNTAGTVLTRVDVNAKQTSVITGASTAYGKVGGTIFDHFADVGNTGTGEDDLYSDTIAASTLNTNGDKITAQYGGIFVGAAASTQELRLYFGGTKIYDSGALAIGVATNNWTVYVTIIRESSSVVRCDVSLSTDFGTLFPYSTYTRITGLTLSGTNILKITGEAAGVGAADNQIVAKEGYVQWLSAA